MPLFERHVFVCNNVRPPDNPRGCCSAKNSVAVADALRAAVKRLGLGGRVRINMAGCLDQCVHGPNIVVYPEQVWYGFVKVEDVEEIVQSHLIEGKPVERLRIPDSCINAAKCPHAPEAR